MGSIVAASAVSTVVTVIVWVALGIVIGVTVRGTGRVLGILACAVPLCAVVVNLLFGVVLARLPVSSGLGGIIVLQVVQAVLSIVGTVLLATAIVSASRARRGPVPSPGTGTLR